MTEKNNAVNRRNFLRTAAATTAGLSILPATAVRSYAANSKIQLGLIGCGSRGNWLARLFEANANVKIVAVHDYFQDRVDLAGKHFDVPESRRHIDLMGYQDLITGEVDAVAVESPPYFHPEQSVAALEAGKHVYLAKPIAVDVPGCLRIAEAAKKVEDKLTTLVDFQTRNNEFFQGAAQRVAEGMIGAPVSGQFFYHCGRLNPKTKQGSEAARLRNWVFDIALSGDIIVEQNIHVLDVANWYLQGHPVKAVGSGGRKARTDIGDCRDHYVVTYTYPDEVLVDFCSNQFTYGFNDLCMRLFGSLGTVESHYGGDVSIRGKKDGWKGGKTSKIYQEGAVNNMIDFAAAITENKPINNSLESAHSTMTSILGRMAVEEGREVTWEEMLAAQKVLDPKLNLPTDGPQHAVERV